jgi:hypothetical protein
VQQEAACFKQGEAWLHLVSARSQCRWFISQQCLAQGHRCSESPISNAALLTNHRIPTTITMSSPPFLSLPAEIRNRIYGLCTPINAHTEEFKGLLLASRQLRREYESEAINVMHQFLASIKHQWPHSEELRFLGPTTFSNIDKLTVQLPLSLYFSMTRSEERSKPDTKMEPCLGALYTLYLTRLTVAFYPDHATFINWTPWTIPTGLLSDLLNPLMSRASSLDIGFPLGRSLRKFQFHEQSPKWQLHIRELAYCWSSSKVAHMSNLNALVQADVETTNFFLHESRWFQHPVGVVHNWGHDADSIWFDLRRPGKGGI